MARIRCFLLELTDRVRVSLRRYTRDNTPDCCSAYPGKYSYHTVKHAIGEEPQERDEQGMICNGLKPAPSHDDPCWPAQCACGYQFQASDAWQRFVEDVYRRADTGEEMTLHDAPAGGMWYDPHADIFQVPQSEHSLMVKTPGGDWNVDGQSNNCTMPEDHRQEKHHCWIRHGQPPDVTVSKEGGPTCQAGAGSIQCGEYHGFLRAGYLEN
jgi:hypothetical protein